MKKPIINYVILLFFLLLLAACTQHEMKVDTAQNEVVTARSTQADCDQIENNLPPLTPPLPCGGIANLFECRLNQGIDEDEFSADCDQLGTTLNLSICLDPNDLTPSYTNLVDSIKTRVLDIVGTCPSTCFNPDPLTGCATIIFQVTGFSDTGCNSGECNISYRSKVCCN